MCLTNGHITGLVRVRSGSPQGFEIIEILSQLTREEKGREGKRRERKQGKKALLLELESNLTSSFALDFLVL